MNYRYQKILADSTFLSLLNTIEEKEKDRFFCRHGLGHITDTARIAYIMALENGSELSKDIIYAAALLHDIGRAAEYETGIPHNEAGPEAAECILRKCGYTDDETSLILLAVRTHGHDGCPDNASELEALLCSADKLSRTCFGCRAYEECNWSEEQKNHTLVY